ncbi:MAG TPA: putative glycoside hydrolase [Salinimicrobium sp.]|nr:putative glycoside hydrolase [Salinimicrobium sp.]
MKIKHLLFAVLPFFMFSCLDNLKAEKINQKTASENTEASNKDFKYWTWITADPEKPDSAYTAEFKKYKKYGIDAVLINTNADPKLLSKLVPLATEEGLEVHAWMFTMNRPGDTVALKHPEWYVVSREGKSTYDTRPYVDYYQFLCPTREASRNHVLSLVEGLAKVEGVKSVHLDYIRFPDVFLPIGLLPKYDLTQEVELPQFDFCYCDVCVSEFEKIHHENPREMENPAINMDWKQFRLNKIKAVVDDAYDIVHKYDKNLTAAVFPYPELASHMVRQRWDKWDIDAVLPMIYHNFYNEDLDWLGFATRQGIKDLEGEGVALHTGIFLPPLSGEEVAKAIQLAKENGASGVSFFDGNAFTIEQLEAVKASQK